jgi:hypothetical protein
MAFLFNDDTGLIQNVLTLDPGANVLTFNNVQAAQIPSGTTAQRPGSPVNGTLRNNSDYGFIEEYVNGSWAPVFSSGSNSYNTIFEDFLITTTAQVNGFGRLGWRVSLTGTGSAVNGNTSLLTSGNNTFGIAELSTGTTTTGIASAYLGQNPILFGYAKFYTEWRVNMPNTSTTAQPYNVRIGFLDQFVTAGPSNGAYFFGTGGNAPVWNCITINAGTATSTASGTAIASATWYKLGILINAAASSIGFYINDTLVVTNTTNIPTANVTGFGAQIAKSSAGTTARTLEIDYAQMTCALTTAR